MAKDFTNVYSGASAAMPLVLRKGTAHGVSNLMN